MVRIAQALEKEKDTIDLWGFVKGAGCHGYQLKVNVGVAWRLYLGRSADDVLTIVRV